MNPTPDQGRFATTQWTPVLAAGRADGSSAAEALASLCRTLCLAALRQDYARRDQTALFARLHPFLGGDVPGASYATVGAELGLSESAVKVAVHRLRQRYRELLRRQILQTVTSPAEVDDEVRHLFASLAG